MPMTVLVAILAAVVFAASGYLKSATVENFDLEKFIATTLVGAVVGAVMYVGGGSITELSVTEQVAAYAGIVVLVENVIKTILRL